MAEPLLPRYPVYVISKGRAHRCLTARFLLRDSVPFKLVCEPHEAEAYAAVVGEERVAVLPFRDLGLGSIPARNWCWEDALASGAERHWILDDNIGEMRRSYKGRRIPCASGPAFAAAEDFSDRYENVAITGFDYVMFGLPGRGPVSRNVHVYSCLLIWNELPNRWRGRYNEDTDLCLQVLADGWCTVQIEVFQIAKRPSMTMKGGNTDDLYKGDGRLEMARSLERAWPGVVRVDRRYGRPQHVIVGGWRRFDTPLKLKPGIDLAAMQPNEYGLELHTLKPVSDRLAAVREQYEQATAGHR